MALVDSIHSFSRLQYPRFPLLRATTPSKNLHFYIKSVQNHNPQVKTSPFPKPYNQTRNIPSPKPNWIQNWTKTPARPLLKRPRAAVDYRNGISSDEDEVGASRSTGSSTMHKIVEKLKRFGYIDDAVERKETPLPEKGSVEDIFYAEDGILPDSRGGLSLDLTEGVRFPWEKPMEAERRRKRTNTSIAELTLPEGELRRLRHMAIRTKSKSKIGGAGVTKEIVDLIHDKWKTTEVVRLKCEGPPALNMKRMHEILERKTGGLVIWRSGSSISLYRGVAYEVPQQEKKSYRSQSVDLGNIRNNDQSSSVPIVHGQDNYMQYIPEGTATLVEKDKVKESPPEVKYEHEVDKLLDGLGPRYTDWPGCDPLPVDADLLPGVVPGYKPPFRILPYGVRSSLGLKEGTALRRLARVLPPHFALGRSRQHQGLAAAIVKLWERSSIVKIALKRGVQLTTSERMAADIKKLVGGSILSRNKDFLVFYRGKDFLSPEVTEALLERERLAKSLQDEEEKARLRASSSVISNIETVEESSGTAGTLGETLEADAKWGNRLNDDHKNMMMRAVEVARHADIVRKLERKLSLADRKLMKAEKALAKVEAFLKPAECTSDPDSITDEERFMFRKLGLRMKAYLLLGRRGVFDGTVENMHLHWKYRELVKILVNVKTFEQVKNVALSLEAESGGVLVSVDKISKGFAVIVYRGKDYKRPPTLRPKNLLTKRKALARSIELQRLEALNLHVSKLRNRTEQLKSELDQMENVRDQGDEDLYEKLELAYSTGEEDSEDEGDDAYLETYDSDGNDNEDGKVETYNEYDVAAATAAAADKDDVYGDEDDDVYGDEDEESRMTDNSVYTCPDE